MRILVVDPSAREREVTVRALTSEGYEVESAQDAATAVASLDKGVIDVLLVEGVPSGAGSGLELVRRTRAGGGRSANAFVVVTAGRPTAGDMKAAFAAGADDFLRKPLAKEELLLRVDGERRFRAWAARQSARASTVDLVGAVDFLHSRAWTGLCAGMCSDVSDMLGLALSPCAASGVMKGAALGAVLPLSMVSDGFEVRVGVAVDAPSARALALAMLGSEDAAEVDVRDMLREVANVAAGHLKHAAASEGRVLTTGLPGDGAPPTFRVEGAKARREWTSACGDTGATLRFEVQYLTAENKHVPLRSLREGMVLAHDLLNGSGALLMRSGTRLTENHLNQLPRVLGDGALVVVMAAAA